jgi:uncharacterized glyoxalase superfamily protein PhnB
MPTVDPRVDAYIEKSADFAKPILTHIRKLVHKACPDIQETMKWSFPHFDHKGMMCSMASFKQHCAFGFWKQSLLEQDAFPAEKTAMGSFGRITSLKDLPSDKVMIGLMQQAVELNEKGIKAAKKKPVAKKELVVPKDLTAALSKNETAKATFENSATVTKKNTFSGSRKPRLIQRVRNVWRRPSNCCPKERAGTGNTKNVSKGGNMIGVQPYLNFNGNCEEAINFYKEALGGEILYTERYGDSPMKGMAPDDQVMHCTLKVGETHIMACDSPQPVTAGSNVTLAIGSNDPAGAETMFAKMADGGNVTMPMQQTFWAERFGMLTDKYGIIWAFNCDKPESDHAQATA